MIPDGATARAGSPERHRVDRSRRDSYLKPHRRKLAPEKQAAIPRQVGDRSLRELAGEFGVSFETTRSALRERAGAKLASPSRRRGCV
jgi:hypothetical protein